MDMKENLSKTMAYYASYIAIGFATGIIGPTLPGLAEHTGTALSGISFLFPTHSIGYLLGSFLSGHLFDRVKGHPVISSALFLLMVVMVLIPLTPVIWLLMGLFFITGIALQEELTLEETRSSFGCTRAVWVLLWSDFIFSTDLVRFSLPWRSGRP